MCLSPLLVYLVFIAFASAFETHPIHAVWITTYWGASSLSEAETTLSKLAYAGINRVYVSAFHEGQLMFPSPTMRSLIGSAGIGGQNVLNVLHAAAPYNISVIPWLEYGAMVAPDPVPTLNLPFFNYAKSHGWLLDGGKTWSNYYFLNLTIPAVQDFLIGVAQDASRTSTTDGKTTVAGVQYDDNLSWPVDLAGKSKSGVVTAFFRRLVSGVRSVLSPKQFLSYAPGPAGPSWGDAHNVEWQSWISSKDFFDEYTPEFYRQTAASFRSLVSSQLDSYPSLRSSVGILRAGTLVSLNPEPKTCVGWDDVRSELEYAEEVGMGGSVIWFDRAVVECYSEELHKLWGLSDLGHV